MHVHIQPDHKYKTIVDVARVLCVPRSGPLPEPLRVNRNVVVALGLHPFKQMGIYHTYIFYRLYHHTTNKLGGIVFDRSRNMHHTCSSQAETGQYKDLAKAYFAKMSGMHAGSKRGHSSNVAGHIIHPITITV